MRYIDWQQIGLAAGATIVGVIIYSYIWKKSKVIGSLMLIGFLMAFVYFGLDWDYWRDYFFVEPKGRLGDYVGD